nr:MBOAT family O-acyltransferase [Helicobacter sp. UBA3407]
MLSSSLNLSGGGGQNSLYLESSPFNPNCTFSSTPKQIFKNPKPYLILGILFNLAFLGFFKYADFFLENFNLFAQLLEFDFAIPLPHILLPLAISFFTFQQIAFLVDCYKKVDIRDLQEESQELDFLDYCLFVCFFPQLIAGPIVHHKEMMPQFHTLFCRAVHCKLWENLAKGLFIFSIGFFKKVFIADSFAKWANAGFKVVENGGALNIFESWATTFSYTFQLYFDFSGYCDMAIGLGLFFGIMLPLNFNSPYKSLNISEFWRRWHITLGRFLKDYLYILLGGNRNLKYQDSKFYGILNQILTLRNLFIVAFLSGIWHGAGWGFIIWGVLHGSAMCVHRIYGLILERFQLQKKSFLRSKIYKVLCWILTFNFLNITWIFFRSENLQGAMNLLKGMFGIVWVELPQKIRLPKLLESIDGRNDTLIYIVLAFFVCLCWGNSIKKLEAFSPNLFNTILAGAFFYLALFTLAFTPYTEFIYFNF